MPVKPEKPTYEESEHQISVLQHTINTQQQIEILLKDELYWRTLLIEQSRDGIVVLDQNGRVNEANMCFVETLGYSIEEIYDLHIWDWDVIYNKERLLEMLHAISNSGMHFETQYRRKDGAVIDVALSNNAVIFKGQKLILCICRDITERKAAEKALKKSEENYKQLFENSPALIYSIDYINKKFTRANDVFCRYYGCTQEEITSLNPFDILNEDGKKLFIERLNKIAEGADISDTVELEVINREGQKFFIKLRIKNIYDSEGRITGADVVGHDITDRRRMEDALRKSEERLRSIISTSQEWIWTIDTNGIHTFCNPAVEKILGYKPDEITGKSAIPDMIHEDDIPVIAELLRESIENRKGWTNNIIRWKHRDGSIRYLESNATAILDNSGELKGFQGSDRDVTLRHCTEELIRKSEERYRSIFENTSTANIIISSDNTILMANKNFEELCGFSRSTLEGKTFWNSFVHKDDLEKIKNYHRMRRIDPAAVPSSYEIRSSGRNRDVRNLLLSAAIIPGTDESIISLIDITEWKKAEKAKIESETRFQELATLLPETVYEIDKKGLFTFVNQTGFEKLGYTQEDIGKGISIFDTIAPDDHKRIIENHKKLVSGEKLDLNEYTVIKKDGSTFPALVYSTIIYREGRIVGQRGFVIDITDKKNLENQLVRAQKMEAIGTLAGGIAHDFNNLLMGILGNISLILLKLDNTDPFYKRLKSIEEYVHRGSALTNQLLGFARGGRYEVRPTDVGLLVKESSELFGRTRKEIHIHHKIRDGLWTVEVDRGQIEQVLLNLYVNASQAMPGGGDLFLSEENVVLDDFSAKLHQTRPGKYVMISIKDTGIGMDESVKKRIFEPFFTTKEPGKGTGLGLASAYGIINNHEGFIHVESQKGTGTTFIIYIPASESYADHTSEPKKDLQKGNETILLIDDEEMILDVTSVMLKELGYKVITASGGSNGINFYEQNMDEIDLVILDMIMPDFSGSELFNVLMHINPSVKILLSSGYSIDTQARELLESGCKGFIQKPFIIPDLSAKLREILDK